MQFWPVVVLQKDCLFLPPRVPTSDTGTYRTACSSTRTSRGSYYCPYCGSPVCRWLILIISIRRWCGSSGGWGHEGARRCPRSAPAVSQTRLNNLHPSRRTSSIDGVSSDVSICSKRHGDPTPSFYCTSCICCHSSSGLHTSWQFLRSMSTPVYLHHRIMECVCSRTLRSSAIPLLDQPFTRTDFSGRAFRFSAPSVGTRCNKQ